jgi:hypothetical protein
MGVTCAIVRFKSIVETDGLVGYMTVAETVERAVALGKEGEGVAVCGRRVQIEAFRAGEDGAEKLRDSEGKVDRDGDEDGVRDGVRREEKGGQRSGDSGRAGRLVIADGSVEGDDDGAESIVDWPDGVQIG